jgi:hypothetical protein
MKLESGSDDLQAGQQCLWVGAKEEVTLCLEPWGNEISLSPGKDYLVVFGGPDRAYPAVHWGKHRIVVYGWSGSIAAVYLERELVLSCAQRVPEMPDMRNSDSS